MHSESSQLPAKLIRPRAHGVLPRPRLFKRLDAATEHRIIWLTAPGGTGKTILTSSYLEEHGLHHLWYQMDMDDGDPANFFHYLGIAARQFALAHRTPLPELTPEYLPSLGAYTRRFFERLYSRMQTPAMLVLDNYHEVPRESPLHEIVRDGGALSPAGVNLIIISRSEPPAAFARLRMHGELCLIGFDELRLDLEEALDLCRLRKGTEVSPDFARHCHVLAQGWTAGLILLLEQGHMLPGEPFQISASAQNLLFDYFAGEIFGSLPAITQRVLLETSVLPKIQAPWAEFLTGRPEAGKILEELHRNDFFITRREDSLPFLYEYHPLFHDFLHRQAQKLLPGDAYKVLIRKAAKLLMEAGLPEDAAALWLEAGEYGQIAAQLANLGPILLTQGRHLTVTQWLAEIPKTIMADNGWLMYWAGLARLPYQMTEARIQLEAAFNWFNSHQDLVGICQSWAGIVNSYLLEWRDFTDMDRWIEAYEQIRDKIEPLPPVCKVAVHGALVAFVYRRPQHPELPTWAEQARILLESGLVGPQTTLFAATLQNYYAWIGDMNGAAAIVDTMRTMIAETKAAPHAFIVTKVIGSILDWHRGDTTSCLDQVREGLRLAEDSGLHGSDCWLNAQGVYAALIRGDLNLAEHFLSQARPGFESQSHLGVAHYHFLAGLLALQCRKNTEALDHFKISLYFTTQAGMPFSQALAHICLALSLFQSGKDEEAAQHLADGRRLGASMGSKVTEYHALLVEAWILLERQDTNSFLPLAQAWLLSRECGGMVMGWWGPEVMSRLCASALAANIEPPYVQGVIRRLGLIPPDPRAAPLNWPWSVVIRALGHFEIIKNGVPLRFPGKAQQKPLELLMVLVANGGVEVPWTLLADSLWPDAEGDAGYRALVTTVQRLRKLLDHPQVIRFSEKAVSLDSHHAWLDTLVFEHSLDEARAALRSGDREETILAMKRMTDLYRGPFLDHNEAPWAVAPREHLRTRHALCIRDAGRWLESLGHEQEAIELYRTGIETDPSVEIFHLRLIQLCLRQNRICEALAAYEQCRKTFAARFDKSPSRELSNLMQPHL